MPTDPERLRLAEDARREKNWKRWGPYLTGRQWATVREDYSADGDNWTSFPYEMSLARAYRWGEDGLLGITDRECRLCFSVALWNGRDPHLKERLFGLTNPEGNHSEDVKEVYFHIDGTPTSSYLKGLYRYPQCEFPYQKLRDLNRAAGRDKPEVEITDLGVFDDNKFWDITFEYAKAGPDDILIRVTCENRGPEPAELGVLPTAWFRNTWAWGADYEEGEWPKPSLSLSPDGGLLADHVKLGRFVLRAEDAPADGWAFTENETNPAVYGQQGDPAARYKDAFHDWICHDNTNKVGRDGGTKAALHYRLVVPTGGTHLLRFRLTPEAETAVESFADFDAIFAARIAECDQFYAADAVPNSEHEAVRRKAYAGLVWSNQFYYYVVKDWVEGDPVRPNPPAVRDHRKNAEWQHFFARDVLSVPDTWEYPAFFSWDLAFHMVTYAKIDSEFAKGQLSVLLREWYMNPEGNLPASEYYLGNVNPPVHAWACLRVWEIDGRRDRDFLEGAFQKLLLHFTWWMNRKESNGRGLFAGGFLGLDNIGVFDRTELRINGAKLQQADGTAWMGQFCICMLRIALELARGGHKSYEEMASKLFQNLLAISEALNHLDGTGLWCDEDGFYYDRLVPNDGKPQPMRLRSLVGFVPMFAVTTLHEDEIAPNFPEFEKRMLWFFKHQGGQYQSVPWLENRGEKPNRERLLALTGRGRLTRILRFMLDEEEFLSPHGIRSLSKYYLDHPYQFEGGHEVRYVPADMADGAFGGNSNWRGPVWIPLNFMIIESLEIYYRFFGDDFQVEMPTRSGRMMNLKQVAADLARRLCGIFLPGENGQRPCYDGDRRWADDPLWKDHLWLNEYFDGDTGRGLGASHQTGWTSLVATLLEQYPD